MISQRISAARSTIAHGEPNRRQQLALERIDFAVGELRPCCMSSCRSGDVARAAVSDIRKAMTPILADILEVE